jgi:hypothetical protein
MEVDPAYNCFIQNCLREKTMGVTIVLPTPLQEKAEQAASARGLSLEQFVCETLETILTHPPEMDPLFADRAVYDGEVPADLSARHDDYLYGESS